MAIQHQAARKGENFPVASRLLPKRARRVVLAFYDFARGADDIADHPTMKAEDKLSALQALKSALENHYANQIPPWAQAYYHATSKLQLNPKYGFALLEAFMQDAQKNRYDDMAELEAYCQISAAPVGKVVLDACGEREADINASDTLCAVLQILNHLQDMKQDYATLNRIYLPQDKMQKWQVEEEHLRAPYMSEGLRALANELLDDCEQKLQSCKALPVTIKSKRLRIEIACIWHIADSLTALLRRQDALMKKVRLSKWQSLCCLISALPVIWK